MVVLERLARLDSLAEVKGESAFGLPYLWSACVSADLALIRPSVSVIKWQNLTLFDYLVPEAPKQVFGPIFQVSALPNHSGSIQTANKCQNIDLRCCC